MKLMRVGERGTERPALLANDGTIRDLSAHIADIAGPVLANEGLEKIAALDWRALPIVGPQERIGPCVVAPKNFVCIGANYADAVAQLGNKPPAEPVVFLKSLSAMCGPYDNLVLPPNSKKTDWEVELGVIIGKQASYVQEKVALDYVAGFCVCNDYSEREFQYEHGPTWDKGKGFDTFGPVGPWLVTRDEIADFGNLELWLKIDGRIFQAGNTRTMIFKIPEIIAYVTRLFTLYPGDIISTGTPPGGGIAQKPDPTYLRIGQTVHCGVQGLGEQKQAVFARV